MLVGRNFRSRRQLCNAGQVFIARQSGKKRVSAPLLLHRADSPAMAFVPCEQQSLVW
jgi:hypothetical protein